MTVDERTSRRPSPRRPSRDDTPWPGAPGWSAVMLATLALVVPFTLLLALVSTEAAWLVRLDAEVGRSAHELLRGQPWLVTANLWLHWVLHPMVLRAIALVLAVRLWWVGLRPEAAWLTVTMTTAGVLSVVLKEVVGRARPVFDDPFTVVDGHSFPSGHAFTGAVFAGCLLVLARSLPRGIGDGTAGRVNGPRVIWALAAGVMILTGLNRIALGVHFVSDVLAGWLIGGALVLTTYAAFAAAEARRDQQRPRLTSRLTRRRSRTKP